MRFKAIMHYSPLGISRNPYSAAAFEGGSDPGVPMSEDGDNDLPPIESSDASESINDMSSIESIDQETGISAGDVDPARTRAVDPARTK